MTVDTAAHLPSGWPEWLQDTHHIGSHYPFYRKKDPSQVSLEFSHIWRTVGADDAGELDLVAVAEIIARGWPLGDRTLVKGIKRWPWLALPDRPGWAFHEIVSHHPHLEPLDALSAKLKASLRKEILLYTAGRTRVGLLLSGGMDSRIVAGILKELQEEKSLTSDIVAITWGIRGARDTLYAEKIARDLGWDWVWLELTPELLWNNIHEMARLGAESHPAHLHGLPLVREMDGIDAILAGSYGNSVGRGIYAGTSLSKLGPIVPERMDPAALLRSEVRQGAVAGIRRDVEAYRARMGHRPTYATREIEQQAHYMRRGLQAWMSHVAERIPLFQVFTSPRTVHLMWGLPLAARDDRFYKELVETLPGALQQIPYAKTGRQFVGPRGKRDKAGKDAHGYGVWARRELRRDIMRILNESPLWDTPIVNQRSLRWLLRVWPKSRTRSLDYIDKKVLWLASLSVLIRDFNVKIPEPPRAQGRCAGFDDMADAMAGSVRSTGYRLAREVRSIWQHS